MLLLVVISDYLNFRHYAVPLIPKIPGLESFPGEVMHSHNYRTPESFQNKTVLCLGAAASGQDICIDLSAAAKMVGEAVCFIIKHVKKKQL